LTTSIKRKSPVNPRYFKLDNLGEKFYSIFWYRGIVAAITGTKWAHKDANMVSRKKKRIKQRWVSTERKPGKFPAK
jgi:hypothetical protein